MCIFFVSNTFFCSNNAVDDKIERGRAGGAPPTPFQSQGAPPGLPSLPQGGPQACLSQPQGGNRQTGCQTDGRKQIQSSLKQTKVFSGHLAGTRSTRGPDICAHTIAPDSRCAYPTRTTGKPYHVGQARGVYVFRLLSPDHVERYALLFAKLECTCMTASRTARNSKKKLSCEGNTSEL